jgi:biotin carboxyl carrier protein
MATELYSPMQGKVVKFLVQAGDEVEEDEPVLMLEALKLQMPVVSPVAGTVKQFNVKEGDEVESDTVLAIIDD